MPAFSSDAFSVNAFSENAFSLDSSGPPPPAPTVTPARGQVPWLQAPTDHKARKRRARILHGLEEEIVYEVAIRQAAALDLDEHQRREELLAELRLHQIEVRAAHFEELARVRNALIDAEIAAHMKRVMQNDEDAASMLLMIGAIL